MRFIHCADVHLDTPLQGLAEYPGAPVDEIRNAATTRRHIAERSARIEVLPVSGLFKLHAKEIEELNSGTSDYTRGVTDRPKRASERDEAVRLAESEWKEVWQGRPISEADVMREAYSQKAQILELITTHAVEPTLEP